MRGSILTLSKDKMYVKIIGLWYEIVMDACT